MDWPLTGAIAGVVVLAGAVTAGTVFALRTTPEPVKKPQTFVLLLAPPADTPGYTTTSLSSNADDDLRIDSQPRQSVEPVSPAVQKKPTTQRPEGETLAKGNAPQSQNKVGSSSAPDAAGKQQLQIAEAMSTRLASSTAWPVSICGKHSKNIKISESFRRT